MTKQSLRRFGGLSLLAALGCVMLSGCGGGTPRGTLSGRVTLNEKPLSFRTLVSFKCSDNSVLAATTDDNGNYTLPNVPTGEVTATVAPARPSPSEGEASSGPKGRPGRAKEGDSAPRRTGPETSAIPMQYMDAGNPVLRYEVQEGDNTFDIPLKTSGK
jgi:hypothetical protein